jgi:hypothetical protein
MKTMNKAITSSAIGIALILLLYYFSPVFQRPPSKMPAHSR